MFTGLVLGTGRVESAIKKGSETRFRIRPLFALDTIIHGESIAVNGACLTVEAFEAGGAGWFEAYASAETMAKTNLGELRTGSKVNLERALALGERLGGHMVSGHVDCQAQVASIAPAGESAVYRISFPAEYGSQVVEKGSIALDGISLTVNHCGSDFLEVNIIPATREATTIQGWSPGRQVNMETDLIGKYVQRMLLAWQEGDSSSNKPKAGKVTETFLREHGF